MWAVAPQDAPAGVAMLTSRRAGHRRHLVELQSITARAASGDGYLDTWTTYATVWAAVEPAAASAVERVSNATHQMPITHLVTLDYRDDVRAQHRVWFRSARALFVRGMQNEDERDVTLVLLCEERADV